MVFKDIFTKEPFTTIFVLNSSLWSKFPDMSELSKNNSTLCKDSIILETAVDTIAEALDVWPIIFLSTKRVSSNPPASWFVYVTLISAPLTGIVWKINFWFSLSTWMKSLLAAAFKEFELLTTPLILTTISSLETGCAKWKTLLLPSPV